MAVQITIIGLGATGTSLGLALGTSKDQVLRVGSDADPDGIKRAQKDGAIDKGIFNLPDAVRDADAVVLCVPVSELRHTIESIHQDLKPGVVVLDTSYSPLLSTRLAGELLPADSTWFLSFTPALNPEYLYENPAQPHADAFKNGSIFLTHSLEIDSSAIDFAANLATLIGAKPIFSEITEVEGLLALAHWAPVLSSAAVQGAVMEQPGWKEARRLAGAEIIQSGMPLDILLTAAESDHGLLEARENAARMIDTLTHELGRLRDLLTEGREEELIARLREVREKREQWLLQRHRNDWEAPDVVKPQIPGVGERLGRLFGFGSRRKN